jgi:hypothetical protein
VTPESAKNRLEGLRLPGNRVLRLQEYGEEERAHVTREFQKRSVRIQPGGAPSAEDGSSASGCGCTAPDSP